MIRIFANSLTKPSRLLLVLLMLVSLCGCDHDAPTASQAQPPAPPQLPMVVTTTTMVTDLVKQIAGEHLTVEGLMGPGIDPHLYKPTPADMAKLSRCKAVVYNGLHLEGRMVDIFSRLGAQDEKLVLSLGDSLPTTALIQIDGEPDPHIWGSAALWSQTIESVVSLLGKVSPVHLEAFKRRGGEVRNLLMAAHESMKTQAQILPRTERVLVTSHDAFRYFGAAYGFEVVGVQGISTDSEAGLSDIARVVDLIKSRKIKAVFIESSVSPDTIKSISKESGATIGGELLSDACGQPGEMVVVGKGEKVDRGTVIGMLKSNLHTILTALQK